MSITVILLTAAAVLAWPGAHPVCAVRRRPDMAGDDAAGDDAAGDDAAGDDAAGDDAAGDDAAGDQVGDDALSAAVSADSGSIGTAVPVADVAGVIDLLALTLRGGAGLAEAMEAVAARVGGPLGLHLQTVAAAGRWGVEDATAWASIPSAWQPAARALRMAASAGVPPADALERAAAEVRRGEQQRLELATATLGVRIVLPIGLVFLPAFILTTIVPIVLALAQQVLANQ